MTETKENLSSKEYYKGKIVFYHGGGFEGCFWEPNSFYVTPDGKIKNVYSSGRDGLFGWAMHDDMGGGCGKRIPIDDSDIEEAWENILDPEWQGLCSVSVYDEKEVDETVSDWRGDLVHRTLSAVSQDNEMPESMRDKMMMPCHRCGEKFHVTELVPDEETRHGCGGIATVVNDMCCDDCSNKIYCNHCGKWEYPCRIYDECFNSGDHAGGLSEVCQVCFDTEKELQDAPKHIRAAIDALMRADDDRRKYYELTGKNVPYSEYMDIKDKLASEIVEWWESLEN